MGKAHKRINEIFGATPYMTLVEEIKDFAIFHLDLEGCIVSWNKGAETIFGCSTDAVIGQDFSAIFTPEDRAAGIAAHELKTAEKSGRTEDTRWHLRPDGSRFYANGTTTALRDESGKLLGYAKVMREITEHKSREDDLRESEEFNRSILEQFPLCIQILSPDGYSVKVNKAWEQLWGVTLDQIRRYNILEDEQLEKKGIMPYIKLAFGGQFVDIPPVLYDPDETMPNLTSHTKPKRWTKSIMYPVKDFAGQVREVVLVQEDITVKKEAEECLELQKTLLEAVTESMLDGILIISPDGEILHFNEYFQRIWSFPAEIIESRSDERALEWAANQTADPSAFLARVGSVYQQPDTKVREEVEMKDGRVFERFGSPVLNEGTRLGWVWTFRDITERKQTEEKMRVSEELLQGTIDSLTAHIAVLDKDNVIVNVNNNWRSFAKDNSFLGADHGIGLNYLQACLSSENAESENGSEAAEGIRRVANGELEMFELEYPCHSPNDQRWFVMHVTRFELSNNVRRVVVAHENVTERKKGEIKLIGANRQISQQARTFDTVLSSMVDFAYIFDREGRFIFANQSLLNLWGLNLEEAVGKNFYELNYPEELAANLQRQIQQVIDTKQRLKGETAYTSPTGINGFYEYTFSPVFADDGTVASVAGLTHDITERKQREERQQIWAERLEEARADERRQLSRKLHDDIVQQLAVASIKLGRLEEKLVRLLIEEEDEIILADLVVIQELLNRNQDSLREMARTLHSSVLEDFGLVEALRRFTTDAKNFSKEKSTVITFDFSPKIPRLESAVENGVYRIIQEAIINAFKHARAELISLSLDVRDDSIFVLVRDDGCGFNPKKTTGDGIGLASMYERSNLIGAKIDVASRIGRGTAITLKVPVEKKRS